MMRRLHRRHRSYASDWYSLYLASFLLAAAGIVVCGLIAGKTPTVSAQTAKTCYREIYVKSMSDSWVNLYSDGSLTQQIPNPFVAAGNNWEMHTAKVGDLKITEGPCSWQ